MANKTNVEKTKRMSKGKRTHVRRLKQMAHNAGTVYKSGGQ